MSDWPPRWWRWARYFWTVPAVLLEALLLILAGRLLGLSWGDAGVFAGAGVSVIYLGNDFAVVLAARRRGYARLDWRSRTRSPDARIALIDLSARCERD